MIERAVSHSSGNGSERTTDTTGKFHTRFAIEKPTIFGGTNEISICLFQRWFFSSSMEPVRRWKFTETESVAQHLEQCPFNIREPMRKVKKNEQWDKVLKALKSSARTKRIVGSHHK